MKKRKICAILAVAMILTFVPSVAMATTTSEAADSVTATESTATSIEKVSLSLQGAYEKIKESTTWQLMEAENKSDDAVARGYSESVKSALKSSEGESGEDPTVDQLRVQREFANSVLTTNAEAREKAMYQDVFEMYYNLKKDEENVEIAKESLEIKQTLYEIAKKKYELGTVAKMDMLDSEIDLMEAKISLETSENTLAKKQMEFNSYLGYDLLQTVELTDEITEPALPKITIEEAVSKGLANRLEIKQAAYRLELQELNAEQYKAYSKTTSKYIKAQISLIEAQIDNETAADEVETDIRTQYMTMTEKYNAVQLGKKTVANAQESATIAKARYDAGMSTLTDVQQANITYYNSQISQASNLLNYRLAVENFELSMGTGTSPISL